MPVLKFQEYRNQEGQPEIKQGPEEVQEAPIVQEEIPQQTEEQTEEPKFGCLMVNFAFTNWSDFIRRQVKPEDIYTEEEDELNHYGYEDESHCTVLFGFHHYDGIIEDIKKFLFPLEEIIDIWRGDISIFENEKYDVVKFELSSDKLTQMHNTLKQNFKNSDEHPEYKPHMTIAYVQKGKGINYAKDNLVKVPLFPSEFIYSDPDHNKTLILT